MLKNKLTDILTELQKYKNTDRNQLLTHYIELRLNKSLESYYKELNNSLTYLQNKNNIKVLKKINYEDI